MAKLEAPRFADLENLDYFKTRQDSQNDDTFAFKSDTPHNLSQLDNDLNFQTVDQVTSAINAAVASVYRYKGSVETFSELPEYDNVVGDVWDVGDDMNYAWNGSSWDALGSMIHVDASLSDTSTNPVENRTIKAEIDKLKESTVVAGDGKPGLMSAADKEKLDSIQPNANYYEHPEHEPRTNALYKITVDDLGHVTDVAEVQKQDIVSLGIPGEIPDGTAGDGQDGYMSAADKDKLDSIQYGANYYVHPNHTPVSNGFYKITIDNLGHVIEANNVSKSDIAALGLPTGNASSGTDGYMSAGDKSKLDLLDPSTLATKNDVLTAIKQISDNALTDDQVKYYLGLTSTQPSGWNSTWKTYSNR